MNAPLDAGLAAALATLGLRPDADARAVRRAYALQLKQIDQATQLPEFQALREAYEAALVGIARREAEAAQARAEAPPAEPGDTREPPATAPDPTPSTSAADSPAAEAAALPTAGALADDVFKAFHARAAAGFADEDDATAALAQSLADDRLLNLEARTIFEWQVAHLIMAGWQPGHEFLFGPACLAFGWEQDRAHLRIFGQLGAALDAAINEKLIFFQHPPGAFDRLAQVIRRLRSDQPPTKRLLQEDYPLVQLLVQRYPNWLRLITSQANINAWFRDVPEAEPSTTAAPSPLDMALARPPERPSKMPWLLAILVILLVLASISSNRSTRPAPASQTPPWAGAQTQGSTPSPWPTSVLGPGTAQDGLGAGQSSKDPLYLGLPTPLPTTPPGPAPRDAAPTEAAGAQYAFLGPVTFARTPQKITVDDVEAGSRRGRSTLRPGDQIQGCPAIDKRFPLTLALERGACGNLKSTDPQTGVVTYVFNILRQGQATTAAIVMPPPDRPGTASNVGTVEQALKAAATLSPPRPVARPAAEDSVRLGHVTFKQRDTAVVVASVGERTEGSFGTLQPGDLVMGCMSGNYHLPITHASEVRQCVVTNPPPKDTDTTPYMFRVLRDSRSVPASLTLRPG
ncbi:MAG: hypothetical protein EKK53_02990 [Burkholderiales bacterium]|nr:MAG: hypothetical protein EKK53_02990 [Burkholderiales bacterium]